jgi:hypothetical protein
MESSEKLVEEMFLFAEEVQCAMNMLRGGRQNEAAALLDVSLKRFNNMCSKNSCVAALATLMQGFQPPVIQTTGMPAMSNPL